MDNFEEVRNKIAIWQRNPDIYLGHSKGYRKMTIDDLALQICQLFDAECQERVERIFKEIEELECFDDYWFEQEGHRWQALKKQEQVSNG